MERKVISSENAPKAVGPYNQAIKVTGGSLYFLSGAIPLDPATMKVVEGDIKVHTKRCMDNLKAVLLADDLNFSNIVKATIYLTDMADFAAVNEVYAGYFESDPPARACFSVVGLPLGVPVEI